MLILLSFLLLISSRSIRRNAKELKLQHNIQDGKITYSDLNRPAKPFFSKRYRITGKPDYIVKKNNRYIPVEIKTSTHNEPQNNNILQLASYCHLIEENYGSFVPYGILVYNNVYQYKIPFDPKIRFELENTIKNMRHTIKTGRITRNHNEYVRCKSCSMHIYCDVKMA